MIGNQMLATECPPPKIKDEIQIMFLRLGFSPIMAWKLVTNQGIDSPQNLASLSDEDITVICDVIDMPGGLVGERMPDRGVKFPYW